jgi:hypothetical protein
MRIGKSVVAAAMLAALGVSSPAGAAVVFNDTFGTSSLNPSTYPTVTSSSTGYDIAATKNQSPASSIASGHLKFGMAATTSGLNESQALFASSAQALTTAGDFIDCTLVFTNANNLLAGGTNAALYLGLYNSGGTAPVSGLSSSGLTSTAGNTTFATGGTQLWQGYVGRVVGSGGNNITYTRPQQNGAGDSSANQDLVGNNAGGGLYNNPAGTQVGSGVASTAALTNGSVYTEELMITLNADGSESITSNLFSGSGTGGSLLAGNTVTTGTTPLASSFDGLALGWRQSGTSVATQLDVNSITVQTGTAVTTPEPTLLALPCLLAATIRGHRKRL